MDLCEPHKEGHIYGTYFVFKCGHKLDFSQILCGHDIIIEVINRCPTCNAKIEYIRIGFIKKNLPLYVPKKIFIDIREWTFLLSP
mgnify:CR=1 FL=1